MGAGVIRLLVEPDPADGAVLAAVNFTPTSTELVSVASVAPDGADVRPDRARALAAGIKRLAGGERVRVRRRHRLAGTVLRPADRHGVGGTGRQRARRGEGIATVFALLNDVRPDTVFPLESFTVNDAELGTTASENVTLGSVETGLLDEPANRRRAGHRRRRARTLTLLVDDVDPVVGLVERVGRERGRRARTRRPRRWPARSAARSSPPTRARSRWPRSDRSVVW